MNAPGRPRKPYLRTNWKLSLPAPLAARIDLLLFNPLTNKPQYGERATLVKSLLEEYLARISPELSDSEGRVNIQLPASSHILYGIGAKLYRYNEEKQILEEHLIEPKDLFNA